MCWEHLEKNATARQKLIISSIDRCYKLRFTSTQLNIRSFLKKQDKAILKIVKQRDNHRLKVCLPQEKNNSTHNLRRKSYHGLR